MVNILFLLFILSSLANPDITVDIGSTVTIECKIPGNYTADTVTLVQVNSNRMIAIVIPDEHITSKKCYMDTKTYRFVLRSMSREREGRYICRFSILANVVYETSFNIHIFPDMFAYSLKGHQQRILYICNRSISLYDNQVRSEIMVGGVSIQGKNFLKTISTSNSYYFYTVGSMDYTDWAKKVTCVVKFNGLTREKVLTVSYNLSSSPVNSPIVYTSDIIHVV